MLPLRSRITKLTSSYQASCDSSTGYTVFQLSVHGFTQNSIILDNPHALIIGGLEGKSSRDSHKYGRQSFHLLSYLDRMSYTRDDTDDSQIGLRLGRVLTALLTCQRSSWEQGIAAQAVLEWHLSDRLSSTISREVLIDCLYGLAHDAIVRRAPDGRLAVCLNGTGSSDSGAVDPCCIGETFYYLIEAENIDRERFEEAIEKMLDFISFQCPRASVSAERHSLSGGLLLSHRIDAVEIWSDTVYMLPPFLAASAVHALPDSHASHQDVATRVRSSLEQIILASQALQAPSGQWSHIYSLEKREFKRKAFWGVGNGWVCAGIVRVLRTFARALVKDNTREAAMKIMKAKETADLLLECHRILRRTLDACFMHMRSDGLFHDILDDPSSFVETNLSQQLAYTIYRLLDLQLHGGAIITEYLALPPLANDVVVEWETRAALMHDAALKKTNRWGFVTDVCGSPRFKQAGTAAEGQAFAILMYVARKEYCTNKSALRLP